MKKNISIILSLLMLAFIGFAFKVESESKDDTKGIQFFNGTWEEAKAKAKAENKLIFVDAYAEWCGPCKILAKKYFTKESVGEFYNSNFINYKMDMEKNPQGERLSRKWSVRAYPTLFFVNPDESIAHKSIGLIDDERLLVIGEEAKQK